MAFALLFALSLLLLFVAFGALFVTMVRWASIEDESLEDDAPVQVTEI